MGSLLALILLIIGAVLFALRGFGLVAPHPRFELIALGLLAWIIAVIIQTV